MHSAICPLSRRKKWPLLTHMRTPKSILINCPRNYNKLIRAGQLYVRDLRDLILHAPIFRNEKGYSFCL